MRISRFYLLIEWTLLPDLSSRQDESRFVATLGNHAAARLASSARIVLQIRRT